MTTTSIMDPTQQKALNALEPYILLSKSATSPRAAIDLINQATSAPNTFVFAELLQTPNIQALRTASEDQARYLTLLEIFAWGTWKDYESTPSLPSLTPAQSHKLRQLTLLSLPPTPTSHAYPTLLSTLSLPTVRALEDLIISAIYAGLLVAKLSSQTARMDVSSLSPLRDLRPQSIPAMVSVLEDWDTRCGDVLKEIEGQVRDVRVRAREKRRVEGEYEALVEKAGKEEEMRRKRGAGGVEEGIVEGGEGEERGGRTRGAKRGGGGFVGFGKRNGR